MLPGTTSRSLHVLSISLYSLHSEPATIYQVEGDLVLVGRRMVNQTGGRNHENLMLLGSHRLHAHIHVYMCMYVM